MFASVGMSEEAVETYIKVSVCSLYEAFVVDCHALSSASEW